MATTTTTTTAAAKATTVRVQLQNRAYVGIKNYYSCPVDFYQNLGQRNVSLNTICYCKGKTSLMNQAWRSHTVNLTVNAASYGGGGY